MYKPNTASLSNSQKLLPGLRRNSLRVNAIATKWEPTKILSVGADVGEVKAGKKVPFSDINAYEVDLGVDGRHCFCKESELLAVVE